MYICNRYSNFYLKNSDLYCKNYMNNQYAVLSENFEFIIVLFFQR